MSTFFNVRQATPETTPQSLMCAPSFAQSPARGDDRKDREHERDAEPERQRLCIPPSDDQAPDTLDQVRDRVDRGEEAEPGNGDQIAGVFIDEMKRNTKSTGKSPWIDSPEPVRSARNEPSAPKPTATSAA